MIDSGFNIKLVVEDEVIINKLASIVLIPGKDGYFSVLQRHISMVSLIKPGVMEVTVDDGKVERYILSYGICRVVESECHILARDAVEVSKIDKKYISDSIVLLEEKLKSDISDSKARKITEKLEFFKLCLASK